MRGRKTEILQIHYVFRVFRFLSPTKLNRNELAGYSKAHSIQPLCLAGVVCLRTYSCFEALKVRDFGSNRCNVTAIMKKCAKFRRNQKQHSPYSDCCACLASCFRCLLRSRRPLKNCCKISLHSSSKTPCSTST